MKNIKKSRLPKIKHLPIEIKTQLFSIWMLNIRKKDSKCIDILLELDDLYDDVYNKNRIIQGSEVAQVLASQAVLKMFFNK